MERHPVIDQWLVDELGEQGRLLQTIPQPTAMLLVARRPDPPAIPDAVLDAWRHILSRGRLAVDQSEDAYIDHALAHGHTWADIADALDFPTPEAAQAHHRHLKDEITRAHPSKRRR
ncbi:hypothetical protein [Saccharothrix variisporea]|uniref:Uncharacterized protein n=1 Tax=Saccharothrix variisporea TaxID=543527 RepID=A0A495X4H8_9PSEU|nr:hypothetical protein [Saccharothrix variisporea]RKT67533.1 hypothetical protein DFJ66_0708 [Saccharothrix variisporea]